MRVPGRVEADARPPVVVGGPAGAEREPGPAARQLVERRHLLREQRRVAEVVAEHHRPERQVVGDHRGGGEGGDRAELEVEVVGDAEPRVAEVLGPAGQVEPLGGGACPGALDGEAERSLGGGHRWMVAGDGPTLVDQCCWAYARLVRSRASTSVSGRPRSPASSVRARHPLHHGEPRAVDAGALGDPGPELRRLGERDHHVGAGQTLVEAPLPGGGVRRRAGMAQHVEVHLVDELGVREVVVRAPCGSGWRRTAPTSRRGRARSGGAAARPPSTTCSGTPGTTLGRAGSRRHPGGPMPSSPPATTGGTRAAAWRGSPATSSAAPRSAGRW